MDLCKQAQGRLLLESGIKTCKFGPLEVFAYALTQFLMTVSLN